MVDLVATENGSPRRVVSHAFKSILNFMTLRAKFYGICYFNVKHNCYKSIQRSVCVFLFSVFRLVHSFKHAKVE